MRKTLTLATAFALSSAAAQADEFTDAVLAKFQARDFDFIEIKEGPSQLKVEAIRGTQKLEVIYDRATGAILKQEQESADADEIGRVGVEIDRGNGDFLDDDDLASIRNDDDDEDDEADDEADDEDDDDRSGDGDSDDDDESDEDDDDDDDDEDDDDDDSDDDENDDSDEDDSDESDDG